MLFLVARILTRVPSPARARDNKPTTVCFPIHTYVHTYTAVNSACEVSFIGCSPSTVLFTAPYSVTLSVSFSRGSRWKGRASVDARTNSSFRFHAYETARDPTERWWLRQLLNRLSCPVANWPVNRLGDPGFRPDARTRTWTTALRRRYAMATSRAEDSARRISRAQLLLQPLAFSVYST